MYGHWGWHIALIRRLLPVLQDSLEGVHRPTMLHQCLSSRSCCWVQIPAISSNPVLSVSRRVTDSSGRSFPQATFRASFDEWPVLSDIQQARSMSCHHFTPAGLWTRICHVRWLAAGMIMYSLMLNALDTNFLRPPPPPPFLHHQPHPPAPLPTHAQHIANTHPNTHGP